MYCVHIPSCVLYASIQFVDKFNAWQLLCFSSLICLLEHLVVTLLTTEELRMPEGKNAGYQHNHKT